jgi:protein SMG6
MVPGYTALVVDTNILLSSLSSFSSLVESLKWTIVVPLPVVMELDGLATNSSALGNAAQDAIAYISSRIHTHNLSLKVQTSKGNYLTTLTVRTEQLDFAGGDDRDRNVDDLILKAAIWQDEHWVDRSSLLGQKSEENPEGAAKVILLSLDRNREFKLSAKSETAEIFPSPIESALTAAHCCQRERPCFHPRQW